MKVYSNNIKDNGYLDERFGNNTSIKSDIVDGANLRSFHIKWEDLPANTKSLAIIFDDYDAVPVCGFSWIHWLAANIDPSLNELKENASLELADKMVQGKNSWSSGLITKDTENKNYQKFGGCAPPNCDHEYMVKVFALDSTLDLKDGFMMNELIKKMEGHVLGVSSFKFMYNKVK